MKKRISMCLVALLLAVALGGVTANDSTVPAEWQILYVGEGFSDTQDFWGGQGFALGCAIAGAGFRPFGAILIGGGCAFGFAY